MEENNERYELTQDTKKNKVKRETAMKHVAMVVSRIDEVNSNPYYLYYIDKAVLFGSYLNSDKDILGDVDIAIYLSPKTNDTDELYRISTDRASEHGVSDYLSALFFAREEVLKYIKNRKVSISLHDGLEADKESKRYREKVSYIYLNKYDVIYLRK